MNYPKNLIDSYRSGEITRAQFTERWAELQGIEAHAKGYADESGTFATYRGATAQLKDGGYFYRGLKLPSIKAFKIAVEVRRACEYQEARKAWI